MKLLIESDRHTHTQAIRWSEQGHAKSAPGKERKRKGERKQEYSLVYIAYMVLTIELLFLIWQAFACVVLRPRM